MRIRSFGVWSRALRWQVCLGCGGICAWHTGQAGGPPHSPPGQTLLRSKERLGQSVIHVSGSPR